MNLADYDVGDVVALLVSDTIDINRGVCVITSVSDNKLTGVDACGDKHTIDGEIKLIAKYNTILETITKKGVELVERSTDT